MSHSWFTEEVEVLFPNMKLLRESWPKSSFVPIHRLVFVLILFQRFEFGNYLPVLNDVLFLLAIEDFK